MVEIIIQIHSSMKTLFIANPGRSWCQYFQESAKKLALLFSFVVAHCWTLLLFHGLTTPFGVFVYLFCWTYRFFPTQTASFFPSQLWAGYYLWFIFWSSLLLPMLMLIPPVHRFLNSLIGE